MKKPVHFLLALAICLVQTTMAQTTFEKIFRINNQSTEVCSVFPVSDGYVLLSQRGGGIINFTKLDSDGNYVTGQDVFDTRSGFIMSASMTSSGSFLVTGVSYEGNDPETSRQTGFFLMVASKMMSVRQTLDRPQLLSTDRHVMQGYLDVENIQWNERTRSLSGTSKVIGEDPYVITIATNGFTLENAATTDPDARLKWSVADGGLIKIEIERKENAAVKWDLRFSKLGGTN